MKESEIKTCPYCGSENIEWISDDDCYNEYHWHCHECDCWFDADVCEHEEYWHQISALLDGTSIENPLKLDSYVILPCVEKESCGLSDLEKLNVDKVHQIEGEGTMWYHFEGTPDTEEYWYDMSELSTEDLKYLLEELTNRRNPKNYVFGRDDLLAVAEQIVYEYGFGDGEELCECLAQAAFNYLKKA